MKQKRYIRSFRLNTTTRDCTRNFKWLSLYSVACLIQDDKNVWDILLFSLKIDFFNYGSSVKVTDRFMLPDNEWSYRLKTGKYRFSFFTHIFALDTVVNRTCQSLNRVTCIYITCKIFRYEYEIFELKLSKFSLSQNCWI